MRGLSKELLDVAPENYKRFIHEMDKFSGINIKFGYSYKKLPLNGKTNNILFVSIYYRNYFMTSESYKAFSVWASKTAIYAPTKITLGEFIKEAECPTKLTQFLIFNIDLFS